MFTNDFRASLLEARTNNCKYRKNCPFYKASKGKKKFVCSDFDRIHCVFFELDGDS